MKDRIYLSSPTMHGDEQKFIKEAFDTNWVSCSGENIEAFEKAVCDYTGCGNAAALSSGTAALHLATKLCGIGEGDIALCSDMTFSATVNPVSYEKGIQVFIDSDEQTWDMNPDALELALKKYDGVKNPKPKAVILAHLYGTPAKMDKICALCEKYGVPMIEDAAESLGATYDGRQTGTFGKFGIYSFNGNKIITTSGGGMLACRDGNMTAKAKFLASQARDPALWYQHSEIGYNYRMSNITAGIGRGQIMHIDGHIAQKKRLYDGYKAGFADLPVKMNPHAENSSPNYWLSCLTIDSGCSVKPIDIIDALSRENIESRPIWKPMHMQPVFSDREYITVGKSVDEDIFARGLCLPSDIKITEEQQKTIIEIVKSCF